MELIASTYTYPVMRFSLVSGMNSILWNKSQINQEGDQLSPSHATIAVVCTSHLGAHRQDPVLNKTTNIFICK